MSKNPPAKSLSEPKHRPRIVRSEKGKGSYKRRPKGYKSPLLPHRYFPKKDDSYDREE